MQFRMAGLIGENFVMRDRRTGSRWQQATGECIEGALKGTVLKLYPFLYTTWKEWRSKHPDTLAMAPIEEHVEGYRRFERITTTSPLSRQRPDQPLLREDPRLPRFEMVMGIDSGKNQKAYPVNAMGKQPVVNDRVGELRVLLVFEAASKTTTAFSRVLDDRELTFRALSETPLRLTDAETGSVWNADGEALEGALKGRKLDVIIPLPSFWFSWAEFFPETEVYAPATP